MKIQALHLDNYQGLKNLDVRFTPPESPKPLAITVIAGVNGSGKTTLLNFLKTIVTKPFLGPANGFIDVERNDVIQRCTFSDQKLFHNGGVCNVNKVIYFTAEQSPDKVALDLSQALLAYVDKVVYDDGLAANDAYNNIKRVFDEIFGQLGMAVKFHRITRDKKVLFENSDGNTFGPESLSSGERKLIAKVLPLFLEKVKGALVMFDEPEDSLHPAWQSHFLGLIRRVVELNEEDCQVIIATHSPQIIGSAKSEELRVLTRDSEGNTHADYVEEGPYGWTVADVLASIQHVKGQRDPEILKKLEHLRELVRDGRLEEAREVMEPLENIIGFSDADLVMIRMDITRQERKNA
ncbi:MAG: AAA family ATPase [Muribaculaceae bacterium]|nr:AAA family ATPase [Muribaculaceae bacterium]